MAGPFYFAWAGAAIQPQVTLIVNGNTHGGEITSVVIVGDVGGYLGNRQIRNIADVSSLEAEVLYRIDDAGGLISAGTYFLFDGNTSGLSAQADSVNLSAVTGAADSLQINLTKSMIVGETVATFTSGSSTVLLDDVDFPAGVYTIAGSGTIGSTPTPWTYSGAGAGPTELTTALFVYDGVSSTADMFIFAATPTMPLLPDALTGPQSVASQPVTAVSSEQIAVRIMGMPDQDWYALTNIPTGALAELMPGLRYNIAGNGIQNGTTFVCPARGATSIELDLPATSSEINGLFTITGPRTPSEPFNPTVHNRMDENVFGFEISQEEGNFATLDISIQNPDIGLLAVGRQLWCWLSYDQNWNTGGSVDLVPLFNGRLVGIPKLQADEIVQLQFLARPDDFNVQKDGLVAALSVLPWYDPVWLVTNVNPDTVLETYSRLWHIDRVSLGVTTSDILQGEDGTISIGEDQAFYDNFSLTYGEPPLTAITVSGTVSWQQEADGQVNVTGALYSAFSKAGGTPYGLVGGVSMAALGRGELYQTPSSMGVYGAGLGYAGYKYPPGQLISMLNGDGLFHDWPKPGTVIGGGWSLSTYTDGSGFPLCFIADATQPDGYLTNQMFPVNAAGNDPTGPNTNDFVLTATSNLYVYQYQFKLTTYSVRMVLQFEASRKRTESVNVVLVADVQRELSDNANADIDTISLSSEYVGLAIDPGGRVPIGALARNSYFQTDRGTFSFQYLLLLARAKMRARARAVDITFAVDFPTALGLTLRNSVTYFDRRLPGGSATGKIKSYKITMGDSGMFGEFTIGCSIGNGNPVAPVVGINSYVEDGYVDAGYQVIADGQLSLVDSELAYQPLDNFIIADDGINFYHLDAATAVNNCVVSNGLTQQMQGLKPGASPYPWMPDIYTLNGLSSFLIAQTLHTTVMLDMKPVNGGEFHTDFFPSVSLLALPKAIDLSAATGLDESSWDTPPDPVPSIWDSGSSTWDHA